MPNHPVGRYRLGESQPMIDGQRLLGQALSRRPKGHGEEAPICWFPGIRLWLCPSAGLTQSTDPLSILARRPGKSPRRSGEANAALPIHRDHRSNTLAHRLNMAHLAFRCPGRLAKPGGEQTGDEVTTLENIEKPRPALRSTPT